MITEKSIVLTVNLLEEVIGRRLTHEEVERLSQRDLASDNIDDAEYIFGKDELTKIKANLLNKALH
jgi:hypothetical protein